MAERAFKYAGVDHECARMAREIHQQFLSQGKEHDYCYGKIDGYNDHHAWVEVPTLFGHQKFDNQQDRKNKNYTVIKRVRYKKDGAYTVIQNDTKTLAHDMQTPDAPDVLLKYLQTVGNKLSQQE